MANGTWIAVAAAAALAVGAAAVAWTVGTSDESAVHGGNHGTIKVHDTAAVDPPMRNQPKVDCDFWIEGFKMAHNEGWLVFYGWPPTGDKQEVTPQGASLTWQADVSDGKGWHFLAGPYQLPSGHYRVEAFLGPGLTSGGGDPDEEDEGGDDERDGHGEGRHFAKTKTFWVECDGPAPQQPPPTGGDLPCPPAVTAVALPGGQVRLVWGGSAEAFRIYRAEGDAALGFHEEIPGDTLVYTDTTAQVHATYRYLVTARTGGEESSGCAAVEVTTIPEVPTVLAGALAGVVGVAAYAALRRR